MPRRWFSMHSVTKKDEGGDERNDAAALRFGVRACNQHVM
jgi:hypothetical protein